MADTRDPMEDSEVTSPRIVVEQEKELPKRPESPALAPLPEHDLILVDLPTEFDPDAEPAPIARQSSLEAIDVEDTLQVPIRSIEDEDAEEARQLAELDKRRNPPQEEGDDEDENLEELLRGLQGDEDGEGEIEGGDDEILAEMPVEEEPDTIIGEEVVPEPEVVDLPDPNLQQEQEDTQMKSSRSFVPLLPRRVLTLLAFSSPLSDLPDLPTELLDSPQPLQPPALLTMHKRVLSPQAESHAESSTTGAKRARLASVEHSPPPKVKSNKNGRLQDEGLVVSGKRPRKQIQALDFTEDDLESISDGDLGPSVGKVNGKAGKGVNGKPKGKCCLFTADP